MSKVEVNQVTQQCGTTLTVGGGACKTAVVDATTVTLGRCGGTVSLASGATQSGFGRTGTVDWITTPKVTGDSPVTGVTGKGYFLNTTAGTITLNLPAGSAGDIISMADYAATWNTNNVTVSPNGAEKIGGVNASVILDTQGQSVTLVYVDSTQGWVNTMDSTSNVRGNEFMVTTVSGACNTLATAPCCANTKIATFFGPGTFCVSQVHPCAANNLVSYMVVAGGGGAGMSGGGGAGGGAGGFREYKSPVTPYTSSPLDGNPGGTAITVSASPYAITVGGGGPGTGVGGSGADSIFSTITSTGGGIAGTEGVKAGGPGGSGGGGGYNPGTAGCGNTPPVSPSQGNDGGGSGGGSPGYSGSGGGGASVSGTAGGPTVGGNGGNGVASSINASPVTRAGGGGGGSRSSPGTAGLGGGGTGAAGSGNPGNSGTINTGGGAGGGADCVGGAGGSGIVIIRYKFQ